MHLEQEISRRDFIGKSLKYGAIAAGATAVGLIGWAIPDIIAKRNRNKELYEEISSQPIEFEEVIENPEAYISQDAKLFKNGVVLSVSEPDHDLGSRFLAVSTLQGASLEQLDETLLNKKFIIVQISTGPSIDNPKLKSGDIINIIGQVKKLTTQDGFYIEQFILHGGSIGFDERATKTGSVEILPSENFFQKIKQEFKK